MIRPTYLGPDDPRIAAAPRELERRISDGIYVQLLWYPHDGQGLGHGHRLQDWGDIRA